MNSEQRIKEIRAYLQMACGLAIVGVLIYHNLVGHLTVGELFQWLFALSGGSMAANGFALWRQNAAHTKSNGDSQ